MAVLITHSLLSAWKRALEDDSFGERDFFAEFMTTLRREKIPPSEAMTKGLNFETEAMDIANGARPEKTEYSASPLVAARISGGAFQLSVNKHETIHGLDVVLHGRLDVLKAGTIYDLKFSSRYERGKFFGSTQHPMYLELVPEAERFTYLVSNGTDVWTESYTREETRSIIPTISDFIDWLGVSRLLDTYLELWQAK